MKSVFPNDVYHVDHKMHDIKRKFGVDPGDILEMVCRDSCNRRKEVHRNGLN